MTKSILFLLFLWSCTPVDGVQDISVISVDTSASITVELAINKLVPLETNNESVFGGDFKVNVVDGRIFVHDQSLTKNIFAFTSNGRFINKLSIGKGPNEILEAYSCYYDNNSRQVYIYDGGTRLIKAFDFNLRYDFTPLINKNIIYHHFHRIISNKWLVQANYTNPPLQDVTASYVLLDSTFQNIERKYLPFNLEFQYIGKKDPIFSDSCDQNLFSNIMDNNLYTIDSGYNIRAKYKIEFGNYNLTSDDLDQGLMHVRELWLKGDRKTFIDHVKESNQYVGFSYVYGKRIEFCIFCKISGRIINSEHLDNVDYIYGELVHLSDDYFVLAAEPNNVIEYLRRSAPDDDRFKNLNVNEGDNPVLVYYRLKDVL